MSRDEMIAEIERLTGCHVNDNDIKLQSGHIRPKYSNAFVRDCLYTARKRR